ncbi:hypothetical protein BS17DRAFT_787740 [Gyrodon lividus]|nr:hypothetical protein BS17DRAFT_787740 [Gyrodon lividus]
MSSFNTTSSSFSSSPTSSSSSSHPSSVPSWAVTFIVIALLALFVLVLYLAALTSNHLSKQRLCVHSNPEEDVESWGGGRRLEMTQRSGFGESVDGMDTVSVQMVPPPPVYTPKDSSPKPPSYYSKEDPGGGL